MQSIDLLSLDSVMFAASSDRFLQLLVMTFGLDWIHSIAKKCTVFLICEFGLSSLCVLHYIRTFGQVVEEVLNRYCIFKVDTSRTSWSCCDWKSRAACAQSFIPWQQATIEITWWDHSIIACSRHMHIFLFFVHIPFGVNHTINATLPERLQQHPLLFTTNHTVRTFFVWRLNSTRPPHPGHSTILLRSEIPSGMYAKLRTVAASNNRDHPMRSLYYCLFAPHTYIFVLRAHPIRGDSYNQRNTTREVATKSKTIVLMWFIQSLPLGCMESQHQFW